MEIYSKKHKLDSLEIVSNPSMMFTGGQAHREEELRQAERPTKTPRAGLKLKDKTGASSPAEAN